MANKRKKDPYSPETVRAKRKFPVANTVFLTLCIIGQIILLGVAIFAQPQPQDRIDRYNVTVEPLSDGSLDVTYELVWTALDESEPLSWVEIGMANESFSIYEDSISENIELAEKYIEDGYCSTRLYFKNEYYGGDTLSFSFKVKQKRMLCDDVDGGLFEFVPGWFNETPVESYTFKWRLGDGVKEHNADFEDDGYAVWSGRLGCGEYDLIKVTYSEDSFAGAKPVDYLPFDDSGAYDSLREDKIGIAVLCAFVIIILLVVEVVICDSYVSYNRGRGFIRGYGGYHMHTYGYMNPQYRAAQAAHNASSGRGRSGGGCACACACACAGGGRAGCSLKDTYAKRRFIRK